MYSRRGYGSSELDTDDFVLNASISQPFLKGKLIASLYNLDIHLEPINEYTDYLLIEIWIRPTITYGLVACFVTEAEELSTNES